MPRRQHLHTHAPAIVLILIALIVALVAPDAVAAGIRHVFAQSTLLNLLVVGALCAGAVLVTCRLTGNARARAEGDEPNTPRRRDQLTSLLERTPWPLSVTVVAAVAGAGWYALSRAAALPNIFADELIYATAARRLSEGHLPGGYGYGIGTPLLDSLAYLLTSNDVSAYRMIQVINVVVVMTAAFPAYLLAQRVLSRPWALAVAGLTVTTPWIVYTRFVMTEAAFYPVFLLVVLVLVRALERPTIARQAVLIGALGLAFATRTQAVVLVGGIVCAVVIYGLAGADLAGVTRAFLPMWILFAAVVIAAAGLMIAGDWRPLGAYDVLLHGWWHPRGLSLWVALNVTSFSLGLGILVAGAFPLGAAAMLRRTATTAEHAVASASVSAVAALLVTVVVLSESPYGQGTVHERSLFFVAPLVLTCAFAWATRGFPRPRRLTLLVIVLLVGLALMMPTGPITGNSVDALSFKLWTQFDARIAPSRVILVAVLIACVVLVRMRSAWLFILAIALAALGVAAASDYRSKVPRDIAARYAWIDPIAANRAGTTVLWIGDSGNSCPSGTHASTLAKAALYTEFFNSKITQVGHLFGDNSARGLASDPFVVDSGGLITFKGAPLRPDFAVADARVQLVGSRVALLRAPDVGVEAPEGAGLTLWRIAPPLRVRNSITGLRRIGDSCAR